MRLKSALTAVFGGLWLGACSLFGIRGGTEEPHYTVLAQLGDIEIRQYGTRIAATTTLASFGEDARSEGFRILASYIFGGNHARQSIAMTAPVAEAPAPHNEQLRMTAPVGETSSAAGGTTISFYMPAGLTLAQLPTPDDPRVVLVPVPPETYAVLRFNGDRSPPAVTHHTQQLLQSIAGSIWQPDGAATAWFYDPPWTLPFLRRSEVAVPVHNGP